MLKLSGWLAGLGGSALLLATLCGGSSWYTPWELFGNPELHVILLLRLRRLCGAFLVGAALASGGTACQAVLHNDLAEPYVLGISGGAGLGAALAILCGWTQICAVALPGGAFLGAALILLIVLLPVAGQRHSGKILLSGVITGSVCGSLLMLLISVMDNTQLNSIIWWLLGNLEARETPLLVTAGVLILAGQTVLMMLARATNALSVGADFAHGFGVSPRKTVPVLLGTAALLAAAAVSLGGVIGFVGLIGPHIARKFAGAEHSRLYWASFWTGGVFLCLCDLAARSVIPAQELPVGVVTGLTGGPFFLYLLYRTPQKGA